MEPDFPDATINPNWRHQIREKFTELGSSYVEPLIEPYIEEGFFFNFWVFQISHENPTSKQFAPNRGDKRASVRRNLIQFGNAHNDIARVSHILGVSKVLNLLLNIGTTSQSSSQQQSETIISQGFSFSLNDLGQKLRFDHKYWSNEKPSDQLSQRPH